MTAISPKSIFLIALLLLCLTATGTEAWARKHVVRITTDSVEVKGWEHSLLKNNPNLSHWHWNPIYGNPQGRQLIEPINEPDYLRRATSKRSSQIPTAPVQRNCYVKYVHAPFVIPPKKPESELYGTLTANNLNGRLGSQNVNGQLGHGDVAGQLRHSDVSGQLASRELSGQLAPSVSTYDGYKQGPAFTYTDGYNSSSQGAVYGKIASTRSKRSRSNVHF
jgi:hypothetical protein